MQPPLEYVVAPGVRNAFPSIGAAVNASARAGRERPCWIRVQPGTYNETVIAGGTITITAEQGPGTVQVLGLPGKVTFVSHGLLTLQGIGVFCSDGEALRIKGGTVRAEHCHFDSQKSIAVSARNMSSLTLTSCTVNGSGISVTDSQLTITNCTITGARENSVSVSGPNGLLDLSGTTITNAGTHAAKIADGSSAALRDCVIQDSGDSGVHITGAGKTALTGCRIERADQACLFVVDGASATAENCTLSTAIAGMWLSGQSTGTINASSFSDFSMAGVAANDRSALTVTGCAFVRNEAALSIDESQAQAEDLTISNSTCGAAMNREVVFAMSHSSIADCGYGMAPGAPSGTPIDPSGTATFTGVTMTGIERVGLQAGERLQVTADQCIVRDGTGTAYDVGEDGRLTLTDCRAKDMGQGVVARGSGVLIARNVTAKDCRVGVAAVEKAELRFTGGLVTGATEMGMVLRDEATGFASGTVFSGNKSADVLNESAITVVPSGAATVLTLSTEGDHQRLDIDHVGTAPRQLALEGATFTPKGSAMAAPPVAAVPEEAEADEADMEASADGTLAPVIPIAFKQRAGSPDASED